MMFASTGAEVGVGLQRWRASLLTTTFTMVWNPEDNWVVSADNSSWTPSLLYDALPISQSSLLLLSAHEILEPQTLG